MGTDFFLVSTGPFGPMSGLLWSVKSMSKNFEAMRAGYELAMARAASISNMLYFGMSTKALANLSQENWRHRINHT